MSQAEYDEAPDTLKVRELSLGGKNLVTTLFCPKQVSKADLKALYKDRFRLEIRPRFRLISYWTRLTLLIRVILNVHY